MVSPATAHASVPASASASAHAPVPVTEEDVRAVLRAYAEHRYPGLWACAGATVRVGHDLVDSVTESLVVLPASPPPPPGLLAALASLKVSGEPDGPDGPSTPPPTRRPQSS